MSLPSLSHIKEEGFTSTKDSHPQILERRSRILAKLSLRELNDSTVSDIYTFEIMAISLSLKRDKIDCDKIKEDCEFMRHQSLMKCLWPSLITHLS